MNKPNQEPMTGKTKSPVKVNDWSVKLKIWEYQARGDTTAGIAREFQRNAGSEGFPLYAPDRKTIEKICEQLKDMRLTTVLMLPRAIQEYVLSMRPELQQKRLQLPYIEGHIRLMTDIAHSLAPEWVETKEGDLVPPEEMTIVDLLSWFITRLEEANMEYGDSKVDWLKSHLQAYSTSIASEGFNKLLEQKPHEVHKMLFLLSQTGVTEGICTICKDWQ